MTTKIAPKEPRLPPKWFIRTAWMVHRAIYRLTRGRFGLWPAAGKKWGTFLLTTVGRRSGKERRAILGYYEDGANIVTMAMNGWMAPEPAWWLNLQAHPDATIEMAEGSRAVRGRAAEGEELDRLLAMFRGSEDNMDGYLKRRPNGTAIVVLEPRAA